MISKTRSEFMPIITVDGVQERDLNDNKWDKFKINRPISYYKIKVNDIQRPDLISYRVYGTDQYWWILMKYNQIDDCWNDLTAGSILKIPDINDIIDFYSSR